MVQAITTSNRSWYDSSWNSRCYASMASDKRRDGWFLPLQSPTNGQAIMSFSSALNLGDKWLATSLFQLSLLSWPRYPTSKTKFWTKMDLKHTFHSKMLTKGSMPSQQLCSLSQYWSFVVWNNTGPRNWNTQYIQMYTGGYKYPNQPSTQPKKSRNTKTLHFRNLVHKAEFKFYT